MGSEQNHGTSFTLSEPKLCVNGCGFFGAAANMDLCSKCYRDLRVKEEQAASANAAMEKTFKAASVKAMGKTLEAVSRKAAMAGSEASAEVVVEKTGNLGSEVVANNLYTGNSDIRSAVVTAKASTDSASSSSSPAGDQTPQSRLANRCFSCNKKVGLTGFKCKCGSMFCGAHRYPENHECSFDFKVSGRNAIAKANPVVKADKIDRM